MRQSRSTTRSIFSAFLLTLLLSYGADAHNKSRVDIVAQTEHATYIFAVALSPDGRLAASACDDRTIRIWDAETGLLLRIMDNPRYVSQLVPSGFVAFSPDSRRLLSGINKSTIKVWDVKTGNLLLTLQDKDTISSAAWSPDGQHVVSVAQNLRLWNSHSGELVRTFEGDIGEFYRHVTFSRDGRQILSASHDGFKLWDAQTGALLRPFERQSYYTAFSPDGSTLLSSAPGVLDLWDAKTGGLLKHFQDLAGAPFQFLFLPDGLHVLLRQDGKVSLWSAEKNSIVYELKDTRFTAVSSDLRFILSDGAGGGPKLWDTTTGKLVKDFAGLARPVAAVASSRDGRWVFSSGLIGDVHVWDAANGLLAHTFKGPREFAAWFESTGGGKLHPADRTLFTKFATASIFPLLNAMRDGDFQRPRVFAFSEDGRQMLLSTSDDAVSHLDVASIAVIRSFRWPHGDISALLFSPSGPQVLSRGEWEERHSGKIMLWDMITQRVLQSFEGHKGAIQEIAVSSDASQLLTLGEDETLKLWELATGRLLGTFEGRFGPDTTIAFGRGDQVISGSLNSGLVRIWDRQTGHMILTLMSDWSGRALALTPSGFFSPSGKVGATVQLVRGIDLTTIEQVHQSLFSPDLVREGLAGDPGGEVWKADKVMNLEQVLESGPAPLVQIMSHSFKNKVDRDLVTVVARITDRNKGIGRIEWRVNGVTAAVTTKAAGSGPDYVLTQQLALDPGQNVIEVVAYNASNLLASLPARTTITFTGAADQAKPNLYILAIGINAYKDQGWTGPGGDDSVFEPLTLARKDAETFAADMKAAAAGQYGKVKVVPALNQKATKSNLSRLVDQIAREIHPRDTFILFAAAHGFSVDGRYYLIPQDYDGGANPVALAKRAIDQSMLQDWLANRIKAKKAVVFLDTCESGALIAGYSRLRTDTTSEAAIGRLHEATGRPVLTASALGQYAYEDSLGKLNVKHGLFTWALLQALRDGDSNGNKLIELSELVAYVQDQVPQLAAKLGGVGTTKSATGGATTTSDVKQQARFGSRGEDFVLVRRLQ